MKTIREDAARTRRSLLEAAGDIFAQKGFRDTTIAEISERAGANIAAVNYHFGSKETLYVEAWRAALHESLKAHPPDGGVRADAPPEERLHAHIAALIGRLADPDNREFWFAQKEFANPTGLLEEVLHKELQPLYKKTEGLVRELLGPHASDLDVQYAATSIASQCINPMVAGSGPQHQDTGKDGPPRIRDLDAYAKHVVKFSLAGLQAVRNNAKTRSVTAGRKAGIKKAGRARA